jgi:hypothetical protein
MRSLRLMAASELRRGRERGPEALGRTARLTIAAAVAYLAARGLVGDPRPVTAALTALLIVQVTLVGTVADTARRILSVLVGVGVAIVVATQVGFTWWSLTALVALALLIGQALRLGAHLLEVPISAMLILAAGGAGVQAKDRIYETVIGALAGVLLNVVVPPRPRTHSAGAAVEGYARDIADLLVRIADTLREQPLTRERAWAWLRELRAITNRAVDVDRLLAEARQSRRLNPRAAGTSDPLPDLRDGLDALEHSAVALRALLRSLADGAGRGEDEPADDDEPDDLAQIMSALLHDLARAIVAFGALLRAGDDDAGGPHTAELAEALDAIREVRARLTDLLLVDPRSTGGLWQLHGSLLAAVERVLTELDLDQLDRNRELRRREAAALARRSTQAAQRLRASTRRVADRPGIRRHRR